MGDRPEKRGRGRPKTGTAQDGAARQAAYERRKRDRATTLAIALVLLARQDDAVCRSLDRPTLEAMRDSLTPTGNSEPRTPAVLHQNTDEAIIVASAGGNAGAAKELERVVAAQRQGKRATEARVALQVVIALAVDGCGTGNPILRIASLGCPAIDLNTCWAKDTTVDPELGQRTRQPDTVRSSLRYADERGNASNRHC